ncbi:MAG: hypothetical protein AAFQ64_15600 [Pseudomonadota bacterium]
MSFQTRTIAAALAVATGLSACNTTDGQAAYGAANLNRNVLVTNSSNKTLYSFYGSNVTRTTWEEDILGKTVLAAGDSVMIDFDDGSSECRFDFRAIFTDGSEVIENNVDTCTTVQYTLQ